jgi:DNA-binding SARP family transcriptional activator
MVPAHQRLEAVDLRLAQLDHGLVVDDELAQVHRALERAAELEPLDESRMLRAAELLLQQGRRGSARAWVRSAVELRARLGLAESPRITRLRQATGA